MPGAIITGYYGIAFGGAPSLRTLLVYFFDNVRFLSPCPYTPRGAGGFRPLTRTRTPDPGVDGLSLGQRDLRSGRFGGSGLKLGCGLGDELACTKGS